jgi:TPR repeat protein
VIGSICGEVEQLLTLSAEQGYLDALIHLADVYCYGYCDYKIDKTKALTLYKKSGAIR